MSCLDSCLASTGGMKGFHRSQLCVQHWGRNSSFPHERYPLAKGMETDQKRRKDQESFPEYEFSCQALIISAHRNLPSSKVSSRVDGLMSEPPTKMLSIAHWALSRLGVARPEEMVNGCHQRRRVALVRAPSGRTI